jgi:hypothetical protein
MAFDLTKRRSLRATTTLHSEAIRKRTAKKQGGWWRQHSGSKSTLAGITPQAFDCCHRETLEIQEILSGQPLTRLSWPGQCKGVTIGQSFDAPLPSL